jgi:hypothetical protein
MALPAWRWKGREGEEGEGDEEEEEEGVGAGVEAASLAVRGQVKRRARSGFFAAMQLGSAKVDV